MATYVIGDIQGCYEPLQRLLRHIQFDPRHDKLWLAGDLVNRGPASVAVLRWAVALGDRVVAVLGNHDLFLLAVTAGLREPKASDTTQDVLEAADRDDLIAWLAACPLLHAESDVMMVHAGLHPSWTPAQAQELAAEVAAELRRDRARALAELWAGKTPLWSPNLQGAARRAATASVLTRIRLLTHAGIERYDYHGPLSGAPEDSVPWFRFPNRKSAGTRIVFGHWAALGVHHEDNVHCVDSGCVWGEQLTALRLDDGRIFQVKALAT